MNIENDPISLYVKWRNSLAAGGNTGSADDPAISFKQGYLAAHQSQQARIDELERMVGMLMGHVIENGHDGNCETITEMGSAGCTCGFDDAVIRTQQTALAWENKVKVEALGEAAKKFRFGIRAELLRMANELEGK